MSNPNFLEKGFDPAVILQRTTNWWCPAIVNPLPAIQVTGDTLVTGSFDRVVKVWDLSSGTCRNTLFGHKGPVRCTKFHDNVIASGGDDKLIKLWSLSDGRCTSTLKGHSQRVCSVQIDNTMVVSSSQDQTVRIWDLDGRVQSILAGDDKDGHTGSVWCVHMSPSAAGTLASGSADFTVKVWDVASEACVQTLSGHSASVASVHLCANQVVSASLDKTLRIWDTRSGAVVRTLDGHDDMVGCAQMDETKVISGSADQTVRIWDKASGRIVSALRVDHVVTCLHLDDDRLAIGTRSSLRVLDYSRSA